MTLTAVAISAKETPCSAAAAAITSGLSMFAWMNSDIASFSAADLAMIYPVGAGVRVVSLSLNMPTSWGTASAVESKAEITLIPAISSS